MLSATNIAEATTLLRGQLAGLTNNEVYRLAFAPLVTEPDQAMQSRCAELGIDIPLRVGTDQRDQFAGPYREFASAIPAGAHLFEVGGGDGATFELIRPLVPQGTTVHVLEPNGPYLEAFRERVTSDPRLKAGQFIRGGFQGFLPDTHGHNSQVYEMPPVHALSAIHMIYFVGDTPELIQRFVHHCCSMLETGGQFFLVFAKESTSYTGNAVRYFLNRSGNEAASFQHFTISRHREALFESNSPANRTFSERLRDALPGRSFQIDSQDQDTSLFAMPGRNDSQMLANVALLSFITALAPADDELFNLSKVDSTLSLLSKKHRDLGLERVAIGARAGMWRIAQPQRVVTIRRVV